jgi:hypothetical protein
MEEARRAGTCFCCILTASISFHVYGALVANSLGADAMEERRWTMDVRRFPSLLREKTAVCLYLALCGYAGERKDLFASDVKTVKMSCSRGSENVDVSMAKASHGREC